jgi:DNA-binding transcriptional LysR family regulator
VAVARDPFQPSAGKDELQVTVLYEVPRVLVVGAEHRFAGKESVTLEDVSGVPMVRLATADPDWNALWRLESQLEGRRSTEGPVAATLADKFELVASGRAALVSAGPHATGIRPDLVTVPIEDAEPGRVAVLSRAGERNRLVADFLASASRLLTEPD